MSAINSFYSHEELLKDHLDLQSGMCFADFGCGSNGYTAMTAADLVGEDGEVYAIDVLKNALNAVDSHARYRGKYQVKTIWSDLELYGAIQDIANEYLHRMSLINVLHQVEKLEYAFNEANRLLKRGGKCLIIDWDTDSTHIIAPKKSTRMTLDKVRQMGQVVKWKEISVFDAGPHHFGIVFEK